VPYEECKEFRPDGTKNPEGKKRRDSVKSIILGIMYGRGAKAIAEQLNCSTKEAQKIVDQFYDSFPKVKKWMDSVLNGARRYGFVETAWGSKRRLPDVQLDKYEFELLSGGPSTFDPLNFDDDQGEATVDPSVVAKYTKILDKTWGGKEKRDIMMRAREEGIKITDNGGKIADAERQCVNSVIQGSAADMSKLAMIAIHNNERLKELDCHILIPVHDEVICECPEEHAKEVSELLTSLMIGAAKERIRVPMKCDAEVTYCWYGETLEV
jgi:DNA polymerase I-like protein with 3'-5' exonuclease and polymerase domains